MVVSFLGFQNCGKSFRAFDNSSKTINSDSPPANLAKSCGTTYSPGRVGARLLSNDEYDNTVRDLLFTNSTQSSVQLFELGTVGFSKFSNDTSLNPISMLTAQKYWQAAGALADEVIATKSMAGGAYSRLAACAIGQSNVTDTCFDSIIRSLTLRAWRRPVQDVGAANEYSRLLALMKSQSAFDDSLRSLIKALLVSPNFLFISFPSDASNKEGISFELDGYQRATRLSYFLWQTMPDDALFEAAKSGALNTDSGLQLQIDRMIKDPKGLRLANLLKRDWLLNRKLDDLVSPSLSDSLRSSMITETDLFLKDIIGQDRAIMTLINANYSFLNKALADHYGVAFSGSNANTFVKTDISATPRRGVLGQASFLVATSGAPDETHPVVRGQVIANNIVCEDIPPPPPGIQFPNITVPPNATPREIAALHQQNPACATCHSRMDPYGFAFENFDFLGRWRTGYPELNNTPIDSAVVLPDGASIRSAAELSNYFNSSTRVKACLVRKLLSVALTRAVASVDDRCVAESIGSGNITETTKISDVLKRIVSTRQFMMQNGESQ
ncbi:MAG: DUF1592 domain-containing protein [Bdellovibrionales bacterium]